MSSPQGKKFLIIGSTNAITYRETFNFIREEKLWLGVSCPKVFTRTDGSTQALGNCCWFTNLGHKKHNEEITLFRKYSPEAYPEYDNYHAINVDKCADIPVDYFGVMGVPITYLLKHSPKQFRVLGCSNDIARGLLPELKKDDWLEHFAPFREENPKRTAFCQPWLKRKLRYYRVFIQRVDRG